MKKPPNPYFLHKQQALAVSNHEGVAPVKVRAMEGKTPSHKLLTAVSTQLMIAGNYLRITGTKQAYAIRGRDLYCS